MKDNFIRVAAATPEIKVADVEFNKEQIMACVKNAVECQAKIIVLPELCLTGYTCNDLFLQTPLLEAAKRALAELISYSVDKKILMVVGLPYEVRNRLYNVAAVYGKKSRLAVKFFWNVIRYRSLWWQEKFVKMYGHPIHLPYPMLWQVPQ